jgi:UDP-3-O-acyl-N-acetylglucosamine deacetylase
MGDLSLFGMTLIGRLDLYRTGHALNTRLVRAVLRDPKAYDVVVPREDEVRLVEEGAPSRFPLLEPAETAA